MNKDGYPVKVERLYEHQKKAADEACRLFWGKEAESEGIKTDRNEVRDLPESNKAVQKPL